VRTAARQYGPPGRRPHPGSWSGSGPGPLPGFAPGLWLGRAGLRSGARPALELPLALRESAPCVFATVAPSIATAIPAETLGPSEPGGPSLPGGATTSGCRLGLRTRAVARVRAGSRLGADLAGGPTVPARPALGLPLGRRYGFAYRYAFGQLRAALAGGCTMSEANGAIAAPPEGGSEGFKWRSPDP
jgi:hypothetical protein